MSQEKYLEQDELGRIVGRVNGLFNQLPLLKKFLMGCVDTRYARPDPTDEDRQIWERCISQDFVIDLTSLRQALQEIEAMLPSVESFESMHVLCEMLGQEVPGD